MLVIAVFSFAGGIYLNALHNIPLKSVVLTFVLFLPFLPLIMRRRHYLATVLLLVCFALAGMIRIGVSVIDRGAMIPAGAQTMYGGTVIESSPNTKIVKLTDPPDLANLKVAIKTPQQLNINDAIRVFGELRETGPTFKNPYLLSWKWLKRLEGVTYNLKGRIISVTPGVNYIHSVRNSLKQKIEDSGTKYPEIIKALTIGDTTGLGESTKQLFLHTGTSHILAISGSNIGIVTAFFFFVSRLLIGRIRTLRLRGDDTRYAALATIPFAVAFMLIAGSSIPTMRATIMIAVFMLSVFFERNRSLYATIALSALIILLLYPHSLFTPSFQLTYASVVFIILFSRHILPLVKTDNRLLKWLFLSVGMTISATIGTLPVVLYHFYGVNPFSVIHNLVAVPLMCVIAMPLSLIGIVLPWGEYLLRLAGEVLAFTVTILSILDWGYLYPIIRPNLLEITFYFVILLALLNIRRKTAVASLVLLILPAVSGYGWYAYHERFNNDLKVNFVDVGNGDAIIVEGPGGVRMLIDGGGTHTGDFDVGKSVLTPILLSKKILTLDYVINTHPHGDHLGGLPVILRDFTVRHFSTGGYFIAEERFLDIMKILQDKGMALQTWKRGSRFLLGNGMEITVLNPGPESGTKDLNNASLVLKMAWDKFTILFAGDIGSDVEERLIMEGYDLRSMVLKVPHHGSTHSSSYGFLAAVQPKIAVLSVGEHLPGIPSREALHRYDALSIPILRTDRDGMVVIARDRKGIIYSTHER